MLALTSDYRCVSRLTILLKSGEFVLVRSEHAAEDKVESRKQPDSSQLSDLRLFYARSGRGSGNRRGSFVNWPKKGRSISFTKTEGEVGSRGWLLRLAEAMFICRPVVYILTLFACGSRSWIPFFLSLLIDCLCIFLTKDGKLGQSSQLEMQKRRLLLVLYLFRAPLFNKLSK